MMDNDTTTCQDYYQFYYQDNNSSDNDDSSIDEYKRNVDYQTPQQLSPRMALFPDLQSLSSNLKRRALSTYSYDRNNKQNNDKSNLEDESSSTVNLDSIDHHTINIQNTNLIQTDDNLYSSQEKIAYSNNTFEEFSFDSDSSSLLSFASSGLSSTVTSSTISNNDDLEFLQNGVLLKRIRSDSTLSRGSDDVINHVVGTEKSKKLSLIDILKRRSHATDEDISSTKSIDYRKRKRADSPLMFLMRRTKSLSSKEKEHNESCFHESKKNLLAGFCDGSNENTLVQPSPFVRTIFQFVESSFEDDYFSLEQLNTNRSDDNLTVFSTSNLKTLSGSKPFKSKSRSVYDSSLELSVAPDKSEPVLLSTGRRISENSEFIISVIAYLDRIRKAKPKLEAKKNGRSRSRQRRCKSDPGINYVKLRKFLDAYNDLKTHGSGDLAYPKNAEKFNVNAIAQQTKPLSLNRRFHLLSYSSNDDAVSFKADDISESDKNLYHHSNQDTVRSKTHRLTHSFSSSKKKTAMKKIDRAKRESLSSEIERLNELNDDLIKFSASLHSNHNKHSKDFVSSRGDNVLEITSKSNSATTDKNFYIASENHDMLLNDQKNTKSMLRNKIFKNDMDENCEVDLFTEKTVCDVTTNYPSFNFENTDNDEDDLQTQLSAEKNNLYQNSVEKIISAGDIDIKQRNNNRGNTEYDVCLANRLQSESPCGEINTKKIRIRVGSLSDKLKKKQHSAKKISTDNFEYWVGEFKPSLSDSSIKKAEKLKENNSTLIGNFKRQFNSIRKKEGKKSPTSEDMNVLRRVSSRSNEDVNTAHKKTSLKQRSASFRLKRDKHDERDERNENAKVSTIRSVFEASASAGENLKKKWKMSSPKVKSAQKMVNFFQHSKKDKQSLNNNESTLLKNNKMKYIQYSSSPRLSPSVRVENKSTVIRKLYDSPYLSRRSPQVEMIRKHFEKSESRQSNNSDYSSICSSNSNSVTSSENLNTDDEKMDSGNHSAESIHERQILEERRRNMRKSMSLDCLIKSPSIQRYGKIYCSHEKMNEISNTNETQKRVDEGDSSSPGVIVVDIPKHLVPQNPQRNQHAINSSDIDLDQSDCKNSESRGGAINVKNGLIDPNKVSEEAFIQQLLAEDEHLSKSFQINNSNILEESDESNSQDSLDGSLEILSVKEEVDDISSNVPSIPQPLLLKSEEKSYNSYSSYSAFSSNTPSYKSYASSASHIFNDLYAPTKNGIYRKKNIEPPPVKPKPKILKKFSIDKETVQPSNVAMVTPFMKHDVAKDTHVQFNNSYENDKSNEKAADIYSKSVGLNPLTRKSSVIWAIVKKIEVALVLDTDIELKSDNELKIESFEVRRVNNYEDVEELSVDTFVKHLKLLDKQMLDLSKDDIEFVQMGAHKVIIGDKKFDISTVQIDDGFLRCHLCIQGRKSWSLASLAYDTLISKDHLEKYCCLILSQQFVVFFGPSGNSKSYLASKMADFISYRANAGEIAPHIYRNITTKSWQKLLSDVIKLIDEKKSQVIFIDGFSHEFIESGIDISELVNQLEDVNPPIYVICTLSQNPNRTVPMEWQIKFKWIWLPHHQEPVEGLLQRFLRRKFIQYGNPHLQKEFFRIVDWLNSVWKNINRIIEKFYSIEATLGPTLLFSCPTDILGAEEWFIDTWNYSMAPYFIQAIRQGIESRGHIPEWEDPLEIVLQSYPWVGEKAKKKMKLREIRLEDIGFRESCICNFDSLTEQKRLMSFLKQLETLILDGGLGEIPSFKRLEYLESSL